MISLIRQVLCTDGVKYVAEQAEAFWLLDKIMVELTPMFVLTYLRRQADSGGYSFD